MGPQLPMLYQEPDYTEETSSAGPRKPGEPPMLSSKSSLKKALVRTDGPSDGASGSGEILNQVAGENAIGRVDIMEDRALGLKVR